MLHQAYNGGHLGTPYLGLLDRILLTRQQGCNSGPFTTGPSPARNAIIPRLAAAFVRTTLLCEDEHPSQPNTFYNSDPTNHYARIVHENNIDGKGYAFAYDDVQPDGGEDQSGKVNAGDPKVFTIIVGGK